MNALERCQAVLRGEVPDRVPVIPQDAHVAAHLAGLNHLEYARDPRKRAAAIIEQRERFGYDGMIMGGDTVCLAESVGVKAIYSETNAPRWAGACLTDYSTVDTLELPDPTRDGRLPVWVETVRRVADAVGTECLIIARADQGAFSLASMMRGMETFMMDLVEAQSDETLKERIHKLLQFCNDAQFAFIKALAAAGAHVVTTGDSIAGPSVCSPAYYREFCLPYETQMVQRCNRIGIPYSIHICGFCDPILADWMTAQAPLWEIDHKTTFEKARAVTKGKVTLIGNLDTSSVMYSGTPDDVKQAAKKVIDACRPECGLILSSGCLLAGNTSVDNMQALSDAAREYGRYDG